MLSEIRWTKTNTVRYYSYAESKIVKFTEAENRMVFFRVWARRRVRWGGDGKWGYVVKGSKVSTTWDE